MSLSRCSRCPASKESRTANSRAVTRAPGLDVFPAIPRPFHSVKGYVGARPSVAPRVTGVPVLPSSDAAAATQAEISAEIADLAKAYERDGAVESQPRLDYA